MKTTKQQEERAYDYWLSSLEGIGDKTIRKLEKETGLCGGKEIFLAKEEVLQGVLKEKQLATLLRRREESNPVKEYERLTKKGIRYFCIHDVEYPQRLRDIPDPPYGLFCKGRLPKEEKLSVAVIGARECSEYGIFVAQALGRTLAEAGIQVISGMARGIDGIAQRAACEAGGVSFAVLGCGVDVCYPSQNQPLYDKLLETGGILSAYTPGTAPNASLFPPRNRIVSGLADAVVVVEARQKSGTLITVDMALEQGREVYVVPGRLTDRLSDGCNRLLKQGAGILLSPEEFVRELSEIFPQKAVFLKEQKKERSSKALKNGKNSKVKENHQKTKECHEVNIFEVSTVEGSQAAEENKETSAKRNRVSKENRKVGSENEDLRNYRLKNLEEQLDFYPKSIDELRNGMTEPLSYKEAAAALMRLCLTGRVVQAGVGYYCLKG